MKALTKSICAGFVTALGAVATPSLAQTTDAVSLTQTAPASLRLRIANAAAQSGRVQVVRLSTGQTLFTETYSAPAYSHRFDFSETPSGRYLVWLQSGNDFHRCLVRVQTRAHGSVVRVSKVTSRAMPASVVVSNLQPKTAVAGL